MAIPLTRVGDGAFNHRPSLDAEAEYDRLRDLARAEAEKRNNCFERSKQAYERGNGAEAKELSNEGKAHAAKMAEYNQQASEYIFRENNATSRVPDDTIDLHGQFVEEAKDILERRIRYAQKHGQTHLHVIVGKGNHSENHVQKLKPRVEEVCRELGLQFATEENTGRIYVNLQGGEAVMPPPPTIPHQQQQQHHGGHASGGRPQQQHHQQQQQQDNEPEDLLSKVVRKIADCCVVM
ncbi:Smr domain protein [Hypoxylon fragiforme]|uniref:Smr domain protein n=1 Tax=Hypoxylon fragiforme TaxID=63214 RepID=UPI0020C6F13A|nr:Smr domain protein [Hypoxylon fragiforme]KAI2612404.1 Smr domain protein [Hypoxylon fragiforme]